MVAQQSYNTQSSAQHHCMAFQDTKQIQVFALYNETNSLRNTNPNKINDSKCVNYFQETSVYTSILANMSQTAPLTRECSYKGELLSYKHEAPHKTHPYCLTPQNRTGSSTRARTIHTQPRRCAAPAGIPSAFHSPGINLVHNVYNWVQFHGKEEAPS